LAELEKLLADNPRWYQDPPVKAERSRLLNEAADLSLYPFLFHGTQRELSAKGLALAHRLYQLVGDKEEAAKVAEDLAVIYPETPEARSVSAEKPTES
jgi:Tfp pilus assembly protein PilF